MSDMPACELPSRLAWNALRGDLVASRARRILETNRVPMSADLLAESVGEPVAGLTHILRHRGFRIYQVRRQHKRNRSRTIIGLPDQVPLATM